MDSKRVTVLRGGPSAENDVSMRTGACVISALRPKVASIADIVITKQGEWLLHGKVREPEHILRGTDVVFLALHGEYGEDGDVQKYLQRFNIPFTGSRAFASAVAFNKVTTKKSLQNLELVLPQHVGVASESLADVASIASNIASSFGPEYIIKPVASGSSLGITLVKAGQSLETALRMALQSHSRVMVEEYIRGREATCAVLENFRNEPVYAFPIIEIIPPAEANFFAAEVKYSGATQEICPGNFSFKERCLVQDQAMLVHTALGLSQYSRSDFILRDGKAYFLEVNTLPGLTDKSLYPKAAAAAGLYFPDLVYFLIETARS